MAPSSQRVAASSTRGSQALHRGVAVVAQDELRRHSNSGRRQRKDCGRQRNRKLGIGVASGLHLGRKGHGSEPGVGPVHGADKLVHKVRLRRSVVEGLDGAPAIRAPAAATPEICRDLVHQGTGLPARGAPAARGARGGGDGLKGSNVVVNSITIPRVSSLVANTTLEHEVGVGGDVDGGSGSAASGGVRRQ